MSSSLAKQNAAAFAVGFIFAIGIAISGMAQPQKVIGFLNPFDWDPALLFVMLGAVLVHTISYPLIRKRSSPLFDTKWHVPTRQDLTARLALGSMLFGIGWGLAGYCPGPAVTSLASGDFRSVLFVGAMVMGMLFFKKTEPHLKLRE